MTHRLQWIFFTASMALSFVVPAAVLAQQDQRTTVVVPASPSLPGGATVQFSMPPHPHPVVILLAGGGGVLALAPQGWATRLQGNFLIRSRDHFRANDMHVVMVDAPSHRLPGGLDNNRLTDEHAQVLGAVVAGVRGLFPPGRPVWLVGTSNGTLSVVNAAARLAPPQRPDGIVLTSTVTVTGTTGEQQSVFSAGPGAGLGAIQVPTLVVWHRDDPCTRSPGPAIGGNPLQVFNDLTQLTSTPVSIFDKPKAFREFTGGGSTGNPCDAFSFHGFNGIEDDVVRAIAAFIKEQLPPLAPPVPQSRK